MSGFYSPPNEYEQAVNNIRASDQARANDAYDRIIQAGGEPGTESAHRAQIAACAVYEAILTESDRTYEDRAVALLAR